MKIAIIILACIGGVAVLLCCAGVLMLAAKILFG